MFYVFQIGRSIHVFKGLSLILKNEDAPDKIPGMLHLAGDFLARVVKTKLERTEHKQDVIGLSLLVDLAIDFFKAR